MGAGILAVTSTFTATPVKAALVAALAKEGIPQDVSFFLYGQMSEFMLRPSQFVDGATGAVVLVRIEDWLREDLKSAAPDPSLENQARQRLVSRSSDFVQQLSALAQSVPEVWVLVCPSHGWIATLHNLAALCRTYANVVTAKIRKLPVTVLNCPPFLLNGECDDASTDRLGQMPYTQAAFDQLGEYLASEIKRTLRQSDSAAVTKTADSTQFAAYLAGLNVQVKLFGPDEANWAHVGRMLRTIAGFCLTGQKPHLTDEEIERMMEGRDCLLVSVSDRLADYGTTGFVLFREAHQQMTVEEMALSCVVLGKQAEFAVLSALGRYASQRGLTKITFGFTPSDRNQPTQEFLESVAVNELGVGYIVNVADVESQIGRAAVKPGAWKVSLQLGVEDPARDSSSTA
jgi:hypothetical protein